MAEPTETKGVEILPQLANSVKENLPEQKQRKQILRCQIWHNKTERLFPAPIAVPQKSAKPAGTKPKWVGRILHTLSWNICPNRTELFGRYADFCGAKVVRNLTRLTHMTAAILSLKSDKGERILLVRNPTKQTKGVPNLAPCFKQTLTRNLDRVIRIL